MNTNYLDTKKVKVLELFAGTKSIGKAAKELYDIKDFIKNYKMGTRDYLSKKWHENNT